MYLVHIGKLAGGQVLPIEVTGCYKSPYGGEDFYTNDRPHGRNVLWTSPLGAEFSWEGWCIGNEARKINEEEKWILELSSEANLLKIESPEDQLQVNVEFPCTRRYCTEYRSRRPICVNPNCANCLNYFDYQISCSQDACEKLPSCLEIDWVKVAERYDGLWLTEQGFHSCRSWYCNLGYKFDCETVVVFKPAIVKLLGQYKEVIDKLVAVI